MEANLHEDIQSMALTSKADPDSLKFTASSLKSRRRSAGNISLTKLIGQAKVSSDGAKHRQEVRTTNESKELTHKE